MNIKILQRVNKISNNEYKKSDQQINQREKQSVNKQIINKLHILQINQQQDKLYENIAYLEHLNKQTFVQIFICLIHSYIITFSKYVFMHQCVACLLSFFNSKLPSLLNIQSIRNQLLLFFYFLKIVKKQNNQKYQFSKQIKSQKYELLQIQNKWFKNTLSISYFKQFYQIFKFKIQLFIVYCYQDFYTSLLIYQYNLQIIFQLVQYLMLNCITLQPLCLFNKRFLVFIVKIRTLTNRIIDRL
ncbi:hypothetical protein ABPG72_009127 [Tetrahymena utriculariae]